jgi:glycosyltransferase involved in cell wall biosynthesis
MAPIPIALCITDLEVGGAERCLMELAVRLDPNRFKPVVYSLASVPTERDASVLPRLEEAGIEVHCLGAQSIWQLPWVIGRLKRLLLAQHPQLVQTFLFHANITGRIAARLAGISRVVAGIRVAERQSWWHLWMDRLTHKMVDRYVCVSQSVADFAAAQAGLPQDKLVVIPNGVDLTRYPATRPVDLKAHGIQAGKKIVTFIGRLERQKGVLWLVETAAHWLKRSADCELLLIGRGPLQRQVEETIASLGISERVHLLGLRTDIPELLAASHLLVLTSQWEGMPNAVLEAMASQLPVVATDVEGVRELLGAGSEQQTVPYGDTQAFVNKVVAILKNPAIADRIGLENRQRVEKHFSLTCMVEAYQDLWESLLSR